MTSCLSDVFCGADGPSDQPDYLFDVWRAEADRFWPLQRITHHAAVGRARSRTSPQLRRRHAGHPPALTSGPPAAAV